MATPSKPPPAEQQSVPAEDSSEGFTVAPDFDPEDFARDSEIEQRAAVADGRLTLERECLAAIGSESAMLVAAVSAEELKQFTLDSVSGFLLSAMDGATDVETILDISGLPRLRALRHVRSLLERGIVVVAPRRSPR
jgi:hypothetical protein